MYRWLVFLSLFIGNTVVHADLSEERVAHYEGMIQKALLMADVKAYYFLKRALVTLNNSSVDRPRAREMYRKVQEVLLGRPGFVKVVVDDLIEKYLAAVEAYRDQDDSSSKKIQALRTASSQYGYPLRYLPSPEVLREAARLFDLPEWTREEMIQLEGAYLSITPADAGKVGLWVFKTMVEQDDRYRQISRDHRGIRA